MVEGKLIVLAGGDGAGKSTCANLLKAMLPPEKFVFTREPGGTELAEQIRGIVLGNEMTSFAQMMGFMMARNVHFERRIIPALRKGIHVISDRMQESTWGYQIAAAGADAELRKVFHTLDPLSRCGKQVDLWIDFKLAPEEAQKRRAGSGEVLDVFDRKSLDYYQRVREGHDEFFSQYPERVYDVDARLSPDNLAEEVHALISNFVRV